MHRTPRDARVVEETLRFANRLLSALISILEPPFNSPEIRSELSSSFHIHPSQDCALNRRTRIESVPYRKSFLENRGS